MSVLRKLMLLALAATVGCAEETALAEKPVGRLEIKFSHQVDGDSLQFSKMIYQNAAGNHFRVVRLHYFISGLTLYSQGQQQFRQSSRPQAINAQYPETRTVHLEGVTKGNYDSLAFSLGVVPEYNYDNAFTLSNDDLHMYWPPKLGGGYHFMKFEGHWQDGGQFGGFAFHLGQNANLVTTGLGISLAVNEGEEAKLNLVMNVNQWFQDPYEYNLLLEGGYTMGDTLQMSRLVGNGQNVFTLKQN